ncbi:MAG TPA: cysteine synthase family protein [Flavisolibacter sp.]|jgi:cysteine synthase B|nr:cysteine synthase family protein [Flavisolibacter sp.]
MIVRELNRKLLNKAKRLSVQVGNTPLIRIKNLVPKKQVELWVKKEWEQLSGSVKARAAFRIFLDALEKGELNEDKILLDATSGNTGIAYATIGAALGIKVALCLPENASKERKQILTSLGTEIIYTSKYEGTDGAQEVAKELAVKHPDKYFYADQYKNDNNWKAHYYGTANEIIHDLPDLTHFVAGLGTTGTFVGTGRRLKNFNPDIQLISFQPDSALHGLEGWKHLETAIVPTIYDPSVADKNIEITTEESYEIIRAAVKHEDLLLSPSSAANIAGALRVIDEIDEGVVVTVLPDNSDKYSEVIKRIL